MRKEGNVNKIHPAYFFIMFVLLSYCNTVATIYTEYRFQQTRQFKQAENEKKTV